MSDNPQDRRTQRRQDILETAIELFSRQGFHRTSTRQLAQAAGVAEGTIFNYFGSKKDLLVAAMSQIIEDYFVQEPDLLPSAGTLDMLRQTFRTRLAQGLQHTERIRFLLGELLMNQEMRQDYFEAVVLRLTERVEGILEQRIAQGYLRPCNVRVVTGALVGALLTFLLVAVLDEEGRLLPQSVEDISDELARLFFYGLQVDPGEAPRRAMDPAKPKLPQQGRRPDHRPRRR